MTAGARETVAEQKFAKWCATLGYWALKMEIPSWRNWPDRQILLGGGYSFFIEFKRTEKHEPGPAQLNRHVELFDQGYNVYVCWTLEQAKQVMRKELKKRGLKCDVL